ncbi:MAG: SH3 domain-containing protein [Pyrinomonadaceae bacterium]
MKQCPSCLTTYTDETLRFCLADGSILNSLDDEQSTMIRSSGARPAEETIVMEKAAPVRVDIPIAGGPTRKVDRAQIPPTSSAAAPSSLIFKVVMVVVGLGILALLLVSAAGAVYYFASRGEAPPLLSNTGNTKQTLPSPTPAKDDRDDLRDQIANLQKQLNEQKKATLPSDRPITQPKQSTTTTTARANSPSDGFLALRSLPSSEIGERILKIPHGATVTVGACGPVVKPVSRSGRWCQASYNGYSGWVFDAFLQY